MTYAPEPKLTVSILFMTPVSISRCWAVVNGVAPAVIRAEIAQCEDVSVDGGTSEDVDVVRPVEAAEVEAHRSSDGIGDVRCEAVPAAVPTSAPVRHSGCPT